MMKSACASAIDFKSEKMIANCSTVVVWMMNTCKTSVRRFVRIQQKTPMMKRETSRIMKGNGTKERSNGQTLGSHTVPSSDFLKSTGQLISHLVPYKERPDSHRMQIELSSKSHSLQPTSHCEHLNVFKSRVVPGGHCGRHLPAKRKWFSPSAHEVQKSLSPSLHVPHDLLQFTHSGKLFVYIGVFFLSKHYCTLRQSLFSRMGVFESGSHRSQFAALLQIKQFLITHALHRSLLGSSPNVPSGQLSL